ncbi:MAG: hypothetical protein GX329_02615 [Tissierellia bacterium]|nr:hypothetical protein [Tissierellia bacterium]
MLFRRTILLKLMIIAVIFSGIGTACGMGEVKDGDEIGLEVGGKDYELLVRSEDISNLVVDIYGIDDATSIIFNDMVVVGIQMAEDIALTDGVKETIINSILEDDPMIRQVLVSDNKKVFDEVEAIIYSLMNGESYDDQVKEINRIIEKLKKE